MTEATRGSAWRVAAATALYAVVHSVLADRRAKDAVARWVGERARDAWYRPLYNAQATVATVALAAWAWRQPDRTLYATHGPVRALLRAGQLAGVALGVAALRETGLGRFIGLPGAWDWVRGSAVRAPMEAQGPNDRDDGRLRTGGAFALTRHPLNVAFGLVLWASPRMTANLAAATAVSTLYLLLGSVREEQRLLARYGATYEAYRLKSMRQDEQETGGKAPA
jgi:hypothetical protein